MLQMRSGEIEPTFKAQHWVPMRVCHFSRVPSVSTHVNKEGASLEAGTLSALQHVAQVTGLFGSIRAGLGREQARLAACYGTGHQE